MITTTLYWEGRFGSRVEVILLSWTSSCLLGCVPSCIQCSTWASSIPAYGAAVRGVDVDRRALTAMLLLGFVGDGWRRRAVHVSVQLMFPLGREVTLSHQGTNQPAVYVVQGDFKVRWFPGSHSLWTKSPGWRSTSISMWQCTAQSLRPWVDPVGLRSDMRSCAADFASGGSGQMISFATQTKERISGRSSWALLSTRWTKRNPWPRCDLRSRCRRRSWILTGTSLHGADTCLQGRPMTVNICLYHPPYWWHSQFNGCMCWARGREHLDPRAKMHFRIVLQYTKGKYLVLRNMYRGYGIRKCL